MKFINIGFGNMVSAQRLLSVISPDSAPVKRLVQEARDRGMLIDASYGRKTKSVLIMDTDHVILSALEPKTIANRAGSGVSFKKDSRKGSMPKLVNAEPKNTGLSWPRLTSSMSIFRPADRSSTSSMSC